MSWKLHLALRLIYLKMCVYQTGGAMMFENETMLEFTSKFLSIIISTNKVVFTSIHTMKVGRANEILSDIYTYTKIK